MAKQVILKYAIYMQPHICTQVTEIISIDLSHSGTTYEQFLGPVLIEMYSIEMILNIISVDDDKFHTYKHKREIKLIFG